MDTVLTVTQLTQAIKQQLERHFLALSVQGEISNLRAQASGHLYFTLKDAGAQIAVVLFRSSAALLARPLQEGDQVVVQGELTVYPPKGNYQLVARQVRYAGVGELLLKFHALKAQLEARGWFDPRRKKKLPVSPRTIGVVTSATGAVIQDILQILQRRVSSFHLILNPVRVQGREAAPEIAAAIRQFNDFRLADVLIVGRGGGSLEDLWPFNEEIVAEAIYQSTIPIISAVGHESDVTLADFVADVRAPTPSAAAELVLQEKERHLERCAHFRKRARQQVTSLLLQQRLKLKKVQEHPLMRSPLSLLHRYMQQCDDFRGDVDLAMRKLLENRRLLFSTMQRRLAAHSPADRVQLLKEKLRRLAAHLRGIDPKNLLKRGYCILFAEKERSVILSSNEVSQQSKVTILLSDGKLAAHIDEVIPHGSSLL